MGCLGIVLVDRYGRPLLHLRITVTHRCNYRCVYCHREGEEGYKLEEISPEEIYKVAKVAYQLGIKRFKLTGGEPLVRGDIVEIVRRLSTLNPIDLSMTTNGYLLYDKIDELYEAGLKRVNISFPSLRREVYKAITGVDGLDNVLKGVRRALDLGLSPVKLNYVVLKGYNDDEFWNLVEFVEGFENLILQVIELEPIGIPKELYDRLKYDITNLGVEVARKAESVTYRKHMHNRPQYKVGNAIIEFVRAEGNPDFCLHCTRVRLTAEGKLKPCIMRNDNLVDVKSLLLAKDWVEKVKMAFYKVNSLREPYNLSRGNIKNNRIGRLK